MKRNSNFRQRKKIGPGSFINQVMANNDTVPEAGRKATLLFWSDRIVYDVVDVAPDGKSCQIRHEEYPNNEPLTLHWNARARAWGIYDHGKFSKVRIVFGVADPYRDPEF